MLSYDTEPIASLASGSGQGAISIVRLSGNRCHEILRECVLPKFPGEWKPYGLRLCRFVDPLTPDKVLDEPMVVFYFAPNAYTGQDSCEIFFHGGPYIVREALEILYRNGFRAAEPGEYTRRAYLSGKMDLTESEGVQLLCQAQSRQEWLSGQQLHSGKLREKILSLRARLVEAKAWLEAHIDFPEEEETANILRKDIFKKIFLLENEVQVLLETYHNGKIATSGLKVAIVGPPNAGKSTLLNHLLGSDRAIVSEIPGTTRDYLEESCLIKGRLCKVIDTAGIRDGAIDPIEKIGISRSLKLAREADVVLFIFPSNGFQNELDELIALKNSMNPKEFLFVRSKSDLSAQAFLTQYDLTWTILSCYPDNLSIEPLLNKLATLVDKFVEPLENQVCITSPRHLAALKETKVSLAKFMEKQNTEFYEEMLAFELNEATKFLSQVVGEVSTDDILDVVFSQFCIGK